MEIVYLHKEVSNEKIKVNAGDLVYMKGSGGTGSFWGILDSEGRIIDLAYGSTAYAGSKGDKYLGDTIRYWTIAKILERHKTILTINENDCISL